MKGRLGLHRKQPFIFAVPGRWLQIRSSVKINTVKYEIQYMRFLDISVFKTFFFFFLKMLTLPSIVLAEREIIEFCDVRRYV